MAETKSTCYLHLVFLFLLIVSFNSGDSLETNHNKSWCMARPSADPKALHEIIEFVCHEFECKILNYDSPCYEPNNVLNHASVAMNIHYQRNGRNYWDCDFHGNGLIVTQDPSYGCCKYEYTKKH